jgi:transposase-like protein
MTSDPCCVTPSCPDASGDFPVEPSETLRHLLHLSRLARGSIAGPGSTNGRPGCPRCSSTRVHRWGSFSGRRRHRCGDCGRCFSDFTGTPFWHSRKIDSWLPYLDCLAAGCALRTAAQHSGVSLSTAFRRRHHILGWRARSFREAPRFRGRVGLEELRIAESFKGSRVLPRAPRSHAVAWGKRTLDGRRSLILLLHSAGSGSDRWPVARGEADHCGVFVFRPDPGLLRKALRKMVQPGAMIRAPVRRGWVGWPQPESSRTERKVPGSAGKPTGTDRVLPADRDRLMNECILGVRSFRHRLRRWLPRFRGVATRHLSAYLVWFNAWSHAFPEREDTGTEPLHHAQGRENPPGKHQGGIRLLAVLLTPPEADP